METFKIKMIFSNEMPSSSKVVIESDNVKRFKIEINSWQNVFKTLNEHARKAFNLVESLSLYWIDEDNDLNKLTSDDHVKTAFESIEKNTNIKIFVFKTKIDDFQFVPDVPKDKQTHQGITCDDCKNSIIGIRYANRNVDNYDLCENCFHKNNQTYANYVSIPSGYGFTICDDCYNEIKSGNINTCITCKNVKVPELNKLIKNSKVKLTNFEICDSCKQVNHEKHSLISESVSDVYKMNKNLQNEIKSKLNKEEAVKLHFDCGLCNNCERNGVSLRCTSYSLEHILFCTDCYLKGSFINIANFRLLSDDEAYYLREKIREQIKAWDEVWQMKLRHAEELLKASADNAKSVNIGNCNCKWNCSHR